MKHLNSLPIGELISAKPAVPSKRHTSPDDWILVEEKKNREGKAQKSWKRENGDGQTNKRREFPHVDSTPSLKGVKKKFILLTTNLKKTWSYWQPITDFKTCCKLKPLDWRWHVPAPMNLSSDCPTIILKRNLNGNIIKCLICAMDMKIIKKKVQGIKYYRVSQTKSNHKFFWLWTLFGILDTFQSY